MGPKKRPTPKKLPKKLKLLRQRLGVSQTEMVKKLELGTPYDRTTISSYERGEREPPLPHLLKYAKLAGITVDVIIDDDIGFNEF